MIQVMIKLMLVGLCAFCIASTHAQDSVAKSVVKDTASISADSATVVIQREVFSYNAEGRRDPFVSLLSTSELRPLITDLRLAGVAFDPTGRNSVAVLRDLTTKEQYRIKEGQLLGRMRVASIQPKSVTFTIVELGYSRQETLSMGESTGDRR